MHLETRRGPLEAVAATFGPDDCVEEAAHEPATYRCLGVGREEHTDSNLHRLVHVAAG